MLRRSSAMLSLVLFGSSCASTEAPPPRMVTVHFESTRAAPLTFHRRVTDPPTTCTDGCDVQMPTGEYLMGAGGNGMPRTEEAVVIEGPSRVRLHPGSNALRTTGLVLAITSSVALPAVFLATFRCASDEGNPGRSCTGWWALSGFVAGGIPAGWLMFAAGATRLSVEPMAASSIPVRLAVARDHGFAEWTIRF